MVTPLNSWKEIEKYVLFLHMCKPEQGVWQGINDYPLSVSFIDELVQKRWKVSYRSSFRKNFGVCCPDSRRIILAGSLKDDPYQRDKTLFHELAHARHPNFLGTNRELFLPKKEYAQRESITEWLGRKARADPELLRHAVLSFGLEPQVYDQSSYRAFNDVLKQISLPLFDYCLLMD